MTESENKKEKSKVEFAQAPVNKTNSKTDVDNFVKSFLGYWRRQTPTMKKIHTWRQQLQEIMRMVKNQDELVPKDQKKRLQELAQEVGASTRGIGYHQDGKPYGYPASIAELIDNINQALQTATFIVNCKYALRACYITLAAVIVTIIASSISISVAKKANKITSDALQSKYVPWVSVTKVELEVGDANNFMIAIEYKNFSDGPALNLDIKYSILGEKMNPQQNLYESDALMPNQEGKAGGQGMVKDGRARQIVDKLKKGESDVEFIISYEDIFGRRIKVRQVRRWSYGGFHNTAYEVEFLEN